jgi:hypothetical protein
VCVCVQQIVCLCTEYALGERTTEPGCWGVVTGWCSLERFSEAASGTRLRQTDEITLVGE